MTVIATRLPYSLRSRVTIKPQKGKVNVEHGMQFIIHRVSTNATPHTNLDPCRGKGSMEAISKLADWTSGGSLMRTR